MVPRLLPVDAARSKSLAERKEWLWQSAKEFLERVIQQRCRLDSRARLGERAADFDAKLAPAYQAMEVAIADRAFPGGVLAVQMPRMFREPSHSLIDDVAREGPWRDRLAHLIKGDLLLAIVSMEVEEVLDAGEVHVSDPPPDVEVLEFNFNGPVLAVRPYCHTDHYWQVYFDTNKAIRETFGSAGYPVPEQHFVVRNPS